MTTWEERTFLAPPGEVGDWRLALLYDAAVDTGLLSGLPAQPSELASRLGLDGRAVRVVLEALANWDVVDAGEGGSYVLGSGAPDADAAAVVRHHGRAVRLWSGRIDDRLHGVVGAGVGPDPKQVELMLDALTVNGRESAPGAVDACLARVPDARTVLDVGGGHGEYAAEFARRGLRAVMQDRPGVVELARRTGRLAAAGVELFAGDFFESLPVGPFDLVFCAGVTYTYDAKHNLELYRRLKPLLAPVGVLALHTFLRGTDPLASIFAVQMLMATGVADTHGEDDYREWLSGAGYQSVEVKRLERRPEWMVLASP